VRSGVVVGEGNAPELLFFSRACLGRFATIGRVRRAIAACTTCASSSTSSPASGSAGHAE
jgi:hypothetical protein